MSMPQDRLRQRCIPDERIDGEILDAHLATLPARFGSPCRRSPAVPASCARDADRTDSRYHSS